MGVNASVHNVYTYVCVWRVGYGGGIHLCLLWSPYISSSMVLPIGKMRETHSERQRCGKADRGALRAENDR